MCEPSLNKRQLIQFLECQSSLGWHWITILLPQIMHDGPIAMSYSQVSKSMSLDLKRLSSQNLNHFKSTLSNQRTSKGTSLCNTFSPWIVAMPTLNLSIEIIYLESSLKWFERSCSKALNCLNIRMVVEKIYSSSVQN